MMNQCSDALSGKVFAFLPTTLYNGKRRRGVAQLVEHYLREVGAACSNHVTPICA